MAIDLTHYRGRLEQIVEVCHDAYHQAREKESELLADAVENLAKVVEDLAGDLDRIEDRTNQALEDNAAAIERVAQEVQP